MITELKIFEKESKLRNQILLKKSQSTVEFDFLRRTGADLPHFSLFHYTVSS
jgi:hypothetical protein